MSPTATDRQQLAAWWPLEEAGAREQVLDAYAAPNRGYHDLEHLREVLERIDRIVAVEPLAATDLETVRLAAFFHDVVYRIEPGGDIGNEEASARWADAALYGRRPDAQVARVADLVRATYDHRAGDDDHAAAVLLDADLGILAAPPARYARYVDGIRREYAWVTEDEFRAGRAQVLTDLTDRPHLFTTAFARHAWEERARANVAEELAELLAKPS